MYLSLAWWLISSVFRTGLGFVNALALSVGLPFFSVKNVCRFEEGIDSDSTAADAGLYERRQITRGTVTIKDCSFSTRLVSTHLVLPGDMLALEGLLVIVDLGVGP
jgi:hypothetical protein